MSLSSPTFTTTSTIINTSSSGSFPYATFGRPESSSTLPLTYSSPPSNKSQASPLVAATAAAAAAAQLLACPGQVQQPALQQLLNSLLQPRRVDRARLGIEVRQARAVPLLPPPPYELVDVGQIASCTDAPSSGVSFLRSQTELNSSGTACNHGQDVRGVAAVMPDATLYSGDRYRTQPGHVRSHPSFRGPIQKT
ncbi:unnamed protein product, partial [Protopolystoma xenopodis]